jgi:hypothetical protein
MSSFRRSRSHPALSRLLRARWARVAGEGDVNGGPWVREWVGTAFGGSPLDRGCCIELRREMCATISAHSANLMTVSNRSSSGDHRGGNSSVGMPSSTAPPSGRERSPTMITPGASRPRPSRTCAKIAGSGFRARTLKESAWASTASPSPSSANAGRMSKWLSLTMPTRGPAAFSARSSRQHPRQSQVPPTGHQHHCCRQSWPRALQRHGSRAGDRPVEDHPSPIPRVSTGGRVSLSSRRAQRPWPPNQPGLAPSRTKQSLPVTPGDRGPR